MKNPNDKFLVYIALADAYAAGVEYLNQEEAEIQDQALKFEYWVKHPRHGLPAGAYTDDTQMSIGVANVLCKVQPGKLSSVSKINFVEEWLNTFKQNPIDGYARGFQKFLETRNDAQEFLKDIKPNSEKNGAAMRAVPLGVIEPIPLLKAVSEVQAKVTHDSTLGRFGSLSVALLAHWAFCCAEQGDSWEDAFNFCEYNMYPEYKGLWKDCCYKKTPGRIHSVTDTIATVVHCLRQYNNLMDALKFIIECGGDTDTAAAITWGIGSTFGMKDNKPDWMNHTGLPGKQGRESLQKLGEDLIAKWS